MTPDIASSRSRSPTHRKHWRGLAHRLALLPHTRHHTGALKTAQERAQTPSGYPHATRALIGAPGTFQVPSRTIGRADRRSGDCGLGPETGAFGGDPHGGFDPPAAPAKESEGPSHLPGFSFHAYPSR